MIRTFFTLVAGLFLVDTNASATPLAVGAMAPEATAIDQDGKPVAEAFGVPMMMGDLIPVDKRQPFIVKDGKIAWNSLNAQTKGSADEVQKALDGLK
jgi:hypothetical protein